MTSVLNSENSARDLDVHRLKEELRSALAHADKDELTQWSLRSAKRFSSVLVKRIVNFAALLSRLTTGTADELLEGLLALSRGQIKEHLSNRGEAARAAIQSLQNSVENTFKTLQCNLTSSPGDSAARLFASVVGFYAGSGGDGDGGIPDLDLLAGVGAHRSVFTHSIIAGAFVETAVLAVVDLTKIVHEKLPANHDPLWDKLLKYQELSSESFVTGASLGIASHLGVDTMIDGFTPYKDLPISLPLEVHEALMGLNAAAEGAYGLHRVFDQHVFPQGNGPGMPVPHAPAWDGPEQIVDPEADRIALPGPSRVDRSLLGRLSARQRMAEAEKLARQAAEELHLDVAGLNRAIEVGNRKIFHAAQPLRLGVIGEFRAGKSTLINALVGEEVAFVDILEATPVECVFRHGEEHRAAIVYKEGRREVLTIGEVNEALSARRHDAAWTSTVDYVEYRVPSTRLHQFELWDAPGMGGAATHQAVADLFLDKLGAAIWVFDATLLGKATIAASIEKLRLAGKPVVAAINRIDEFNDDVTQAHALLTRIYPRSFNAEVAISASEACKTVFAGERSDPLERLWEAVGECVGISESEGQEMRLERAAEAACEDLGRWVTEARREAEDRVGLVEHAQENLRLARRKLMESLASILDEETAAEFQQVKLELASKVEQLDRIPSVAAKIVAFFNDQGIQQRITQDIFRRAIARVTTLWGRHSDEAIDLSKAAVPLARVSLAALRQGESVERAAIEEAVYAGGVSFSIAAVVAATTAVTWPAILVAIPIGSLAWWKKVRQSERDQSTPSERFDKAMDDLRRRFVEQVLPRIAEGIEKSLDAAIAQRVRGECLEVLSEPHDGKARIATGDLRALESVLARAHSAALEADFSWEALLRLLQNPGPRLDIYTPSTGFSMAPLLQCLPPGTDIRMVTRCLEKDRKRLTDEVERAFGNWQGRRKVYGVCLADGSPLPIDQTMLITTDFALVTDQSLGSVGDGSARFSRYANGTLAGQRKFAELWDGKSSEYGELRRHSVY